MTCLSFFSSEKVFLLFTTRYTYVSSQIFYFTYTLHCTFLLFQYVKDLFVNQRFYTFAKLWRSRLSSNKQKL